MIRIMSDNKAKPIDPTNDAEDMMGDTYGLTGITTNTNPKTQDQDDDLEDISQMSDIAELVSKDMAEEDEVITSPSTNLPVLDQDEAAGNDTLSVPVSPAVSGEQSVSGDMPDPSSDDDTLSNAQAMGFQMDEDIEHPQELDMARDIDLAEQEIRQQ
jgi:hypothetical protein